MSYRVWNIDGKEMIYLEPSGLQYYDFEGSWSLGFTVDGYSGFWGHEQYESQTKKAKKYPIMRDTELIDSKKNKVWEGDIMECGQKGQTKLGVIVYAEGGFRWEFGPGEKSFAYGCVEKFGGTVVGNIYQDVYLLDNK